MCFAQPQWLLWTPLKTKLSTAGCFTTSEFVCITEQCDSYEENAREGRPLQLSYSHAIVQSCPADFVVIP